MSYNGALTTLIYGTHYFWQQSIDNNETKWRDVISSPLYQKPTHLSWKIQNTSAIRLKIWIIRNWHHGSFDTVSLFTNVPPDGALSTVKKGPGGKWGLQWMITALYGCNNGTSWSKAIAKTTNDGGWPMNHLGLLLCKSHVR
jgi:hypothetical protein